MSLRFSSQAVHIMGSVLLNIRIWIAWTNVSILRRNSSFRFANFNIIFTIPPLIGSKIELLKMQRWVKERGAKIVVVVEGRDAAGKGFECNVFFDPTQIKLLHQRGNKTAHRKFESTRCTSGCSR